MLGDARACADACEAYLATAQSDAVVAAAAALAVLDDLLDLHPHLLLAATRVCRELATALSGRITVDSAPGRGTTFTVTLPRSERKAA